MNQIKLKSPTVLFLDSLDILRPHIFCIHPTYQIEFLQENSKKFRRPCIKNGKEHTGKSFKSVREFDKPTGKSFSDKQRSAS